MKKIGIGVACCHFHTLLSAPLPVRPLEHFWFLITSCPKAKISERSRRGPPVLGKEESEERDRSRERGLGWILALGCGVWGSDLKIRADLKAGQGCAAPGCARCPRQPRLSIPRALQLWDLCGCAFLGQHLLQVEGGESSGMVGLEKKKKKHLQALSVQLSDLGKIPGEALKLFRAPSH